MCRCCGKELLEGEVYLSEVDGTPEVLCMACRAFYGGVLCRG